MHIHSTRTSYRSTLRSHHGTYGLSTEPGFQNALMRRLILTPLKTNGTMILDNPSTDTMLHLGTNDCLRLYHFH